MVICALLLFEYLDAVRIAFPCGREKFEDPRPFTRMQIIEMPTLLTKIIPRDQDELYQE